MKHRGARAPSSSSLPEERGKNFLSAGSDPLHSAAVRVWGEQSDRPL